MKLDSVNVTYLSKINYRSYSYAEFSDTINLMNTITTKVEEVEKRLQFTIMLAMFSPVLLETFLNWSKVEAEVLSRAVLASAGISIVGLVLNYLVFEWRKNKLTERVLDYLNWTFFATIICYACVFLSLSLMSIASTAVGSRFAHYMFMTTFSGSMRIPDVTLAILLIDFIIKKSKTI